MSGGYKYREVIARLEAASEPSRELDSAIGRALEPFPTQPFNQEGPFYRLQGMYWVLGKKDTPNGPVEEKWSRCPPLYTASLDVALTLVPSHHLWQVRRGIEISAVVWMIEIDYDEHNPPVGYNSASPTIALCIAALKARAELDSRSHKQGELGADRIHT